MRRLAQIALAAFLMSSNASAGESVKSTPSHPASHQSGYQYQDVNLYRLVDGMSNGAKCAQANPKELYQLKAALGNPQIPPELAGKSDDLVEKALFFKFAAKSASDNARCLSDHLAQIAQDKKFSPIETQTIDYLARHIEEMRELTNDVNLTKSQIDAQESEESRVGPGMFTNTDDLEDHLKVAQARLATLWSGIWRIQDPAMQNYVNQLIKKDITGLEYRRLNVSPNQSQVGGSNLSLRVGAIQAMQKEASSAATRLAQVSQTGKMTFEEKQKIVQFSDALPMLAKRHFNGTALACRLNSEFGRGPEKVSFAINAAAVVSIPLSFGETALAGAAIKGGSMVVRVASVAMKGLALASGEGASAAFLGQAIGQCVDQVQNSKGSTLLVNQCAQGQEWTETQVSMAKEGNCAANLAMAVLPRVGAKMGKVLAKSAARPAENLGAKALTAESRATLAASESPKLNMSLATDSAAARDVAASVRNTIRESLSSATTKSLDASVKREVLAKAGQLTAKERADIAFDTIRSRVSPSDSQAAYDKLSKALAKAHDEVGKGKGFNLLSPSEEKELIKAVMTEKKVSEAEARALVRQNVYSEAELKEKLRILMQEGGLSQKEAVALLRNGVAGKPMPLNPVTMKWEAEAAYRYVSSPNDVLKATANLVGRQNPAMQTRLLNAFKSKVPFSGRTGVDQIMREMRSTPSLSHSDRALLDEVEKSLNAKADASSMQAARRLADDAKVRGSHGTEVEGLTKALDSKGASEVLAKLPPGEARTKALAHLDKEIATLKGRGRLNDFEQKQLNAMEETKAAAAAHEAEARAEAARKVAAQAPPPVPLTPTLPQGPAATATRAEVQQLSRTADDAVHAAEKSQNPADYMSAGDKCAQSGDYFKATFAYQAAGDGKKVAAAWHKYAGKDFENPSTSMYVWNRSRIVERLKDQAENFTDEVKSFKSPEGLTGTNLIRYNNYHATLQAIEILENPALK